MNTTPEQILDFWIEIGPEKWWKRDNAVDSKIRERFAGTLEDARKGKLDHWLEEPDSALALIIIFDQFSRNLNRGSAQAFAEDTRCVHLVRGIIDRGLDERIRNDLRAFCYLPLMHAENPYDQDRCVEEMQKLNLEGNIKAAKEHAEIIHRFGRFPHRNKVLGRKTTPAEQAFLDDGGFSG